MSKTMIAVLAGLAVAVAPTGWAQSSASYRVSDQSFNAAGHPAQGTVFASAGYRIRFDAIGGVVVGTTMSSASYSVDGSMVSSYPPPGEVVGLRFAAKEILAWNPERSVGTYNLYRGLVQGLAGLGYGDCLQDGLPGDTATDGALPVTGQAYFYLVTAENLLAEEGSRGVDSAGADRGNANACP